VKTPFLVVGKLKFDSYEVTVFYIYHNAVVNLIYIVKAFSYIFLHVNETIIHNFCTKSVNKRKRG